MHSDKWMAGLFFLLALLLSWGGTLLSVGIARRHRLLAHPVSRSSHQVPTPQVGGVGICLAALLLFFWGFWDFPWLVAPFLSALIIGLAIGLADDVLSMAAIPKLFLQIVLCGVPAALVVLAPSGGALTVRALLAVVLIGGWLLFFVNAFNFMDGTNGLAGSFAINAAFWLAGLSRLPGFSSGPVLPFYQYGFIVAGACAGFLIENLRSRTFMGDCGSLPLGAVLGLLAVFHWIFSGFEWWALGGAMLVLLPFSYDVLYTLARRARRGANLLEAHREHLYQRLLVATGWSHERLLVLHLVYFLVCGVAGASMSHGPTLWCRAGGAALGLLAVLAYTVYVLHRERNGVQGVQA